MKKEFYINQYVLNQTNRIWKELKHLNLSISCSWDLSMHEVWYLLKQPSVEHAIIKPKSSSWHLTHFVDIVEFMCAGIVLVVALALFICDWFDSIHIDWCKTLFSLSFMIKLVSILSRHIFVLFFSLLEESVGVAALSSVCKLSTFWLSRTSFSLYKEMNGNKY